jgi:hypothetical protein
MNVIPLVLQIAALVFFALAFFNFSRYNWFAGAWGLLLLSVMLAGSISIPLHTVGAH